MVRASDIPSSIRRAIGTRHAMYARTAAFLSIGEAAGTAGVEAQPARVTIKSNRIFKVALLPGIGACCGWRSSWGSGRGRLTSLEGRDRRLHDANIRRLHTVVHRHSDRENRQNSCQRSDPEGLLESTSLFGRRSCALGCSLSTFCRRDRTLTQHCHSTLMPSHLRNMAGHLHHQRVDLSVERGEPHIHARLVAVKFRVDFFSGRLGSHVHMMVRSARVVNEAPCIICRE